MASDQRQLHTEKAAAALGAADGDSAAVGHANRADNRQSQTGSTHLPGTRFIGSIETIEDVGQIICRYAQPRIRDFENRMTVPLCHSDGDLSSSGVYLIALSRRFTTTCLSREGSASTSTGSVPSAINEMCFSSASSLIWTAVLRASSAKSRSSGWLRASPASRREIARRPSTISDNR